MLFVVQVVNRQGGLASEGNYQSEEDEEVSPSLHSLLRICDVDECADGQGKHAE